MKKGILTKKIEWAKHLRPWGKREQWSRERIAEKSEIEKEYDDLINGAEVVFDDQTYDIYEEESHPPYPHF
jgi:hypothetical protein